MSRTFPWERWSTILIGYFCLVIPDLIMASIHTVSSTCGYDFFLPPLQRFDSTSIVGWIEVVACRDVSQPAVSVSVTLSTTSGDKVHTFAVSSNETARVEMAPLVRKDESIAKYGLRLTTSQKTSAYAHLSAGNDVMTLIPFDAITTSYLIPDLRTSDFEEQRAFFYNIYSRTNVTVTTHSYTDYQSLWPASEFEKTNSSDSGSSSSSNNNTNNGGGSVSDALSYANNNGSLTLTTSLSSGDTSTVSTTTVKATPTNINSQNDSSSNNNNNTNNSNMNNNVYDTHTNNVTTSIFYFSSAMQTRSLLVESDSAVFLRSNKPLGVVVLLSLSSSYSSSPSSLETSSSSSWLGDDVTSVAGSEGGGVVVGGGEGEEETVTLEMVPPLSSLGKYFYLPLLEGFSLVKLVVSGQQNATLEIQWDASNALRSSRHSIVTPQSLLLEQPIRDVLPDAHVWMVSTSPVLVYAVIEICVSGGDEEEPSAAAAAGDPLCYVNAFFLPAVEQYFRCAVEVSDNDCRKVCPAFWTSGTCGSTPDDGVVPPASSEAFQSSGASAATKSTVSSSSSGVGDSWVWPVRHTVNGTSLNNTTDACVVANASYLPFRLDLASVSFLPAGSRLAKLYSACVPNISAQGGKGDGEDNDCDGLIDEELENMVDDDGDGRIDEDTASDCENDVSLRTARSGGLQRAVAAAGPGPPWSFEGYQQEDSQMPLLAVIISLSVAIFAVVAVISIFLLMELMSRRRQIRNTKIRPFVS